MTVRANDIAHRWNRRIALTLGAAALGLTVAASGQQLPPDALATCTVTQSSFNSWFDAGHPSLNGSVKAANSITFVPSNNCAFYAWSHQMFMWLTSPAPSLYGGKGRIFNSPVFYDVSVLANGQRHFIAHVQRPTPFVLGAAKVGVNDLPVVLDRKGIAREIIDAPRAASGRPTILVAGKPVEIQNITGAPGAKATLIDRAGKPIAASVALRPEIVPKGLLAPQSRLMAIGGPKLTTASARMDFVLARLKNSRIAERFVFNGKPIFVDLSSGAVIDIDAGQAGGNGVLLAQNGSVIFYQTVVNDVYAYFLTGQSHHALPASNQFPTTGPMSAAITQYAATNGVKNKVIVDPEALTIEAKISWIEVTASLPNPGSYITTQAIIPVYNTSSTTSWPVASSRVATLAMVGVHVVGSVAGHPEMFWATFEHFGNTPLAQYPYNNSAGTQNVMPSAGGMYVYVANVAAISPSDTLRTAPFGTPDIATQPNPGDPTVAAANTELIALNNNIAAGSAAADVRNNYFQSGTTWTNNGQGGTGAWPGGNEIGTNFLANSTMETYHQGANYQTGGFNCFTRHGSNTTSVSHMYSSLQPLF